MKLFNKQVSDFQTSLGKSFKRKFKVIQFTKEEIEEFSNQISSNISLLEKSDEELFTKVDLVKRILEGKPKLSKVNTAVLWKYLKVLYSIASGKKIVIKEKNLENTISEMMKDDTSGFKNLVSDISLQLKDSMGDRELDKGQIMKDLMTGNLVTSGIDFNVIIKNASEKLKAGVASGDINLENLLKASEQIKELL